jgi:hypothetical protein
VRASGEKNSAASSKPAVTTLAKPVRAPACTPAALSTYAVTVEVPRIVPTMVPAASVAVL